jgi:hypothetical protein
MVFFVPIGDNVEFSLEDRWDFPCSGDLQRWERPFLFVCVVMHIETMV